MAASKYNEQMVRKIIEYIEEDSYSQKEICKMLKISEDTIIAWKNKYPDFLERVNNAHIRRLEKFKFAARRSLTKLIEGYEAEDVKTFYTAVKGEAVIREQVVTKKHYKPDTAAVIFTLTNVDADNFSNKMRQEIATANSFSINIEAANKEAAEEINKEVNNDNEA